MNFLQRLLEPSTFAGLTGMMGSAANLLGANPTKVQVAQSAIGALFSALAIFLPERGNTTPQG